MILEIPDINGNAVSIPVEKMQFFWQKQNRLMHYRVTQIVYNTDEPLVFEGGSPAGEIPWKQGRVVSGRAVADTLLSLDEVWAAMKAVCPDQFVISLCRAYTVEDMRVFCLCPSELIRSLLQHFEPILNSERDENNRNIRGKEIEDMLFSIDGGGDGEQHIDYPLHGISTYADYRIYLMGHPFQIMAAIYRCPPYRYEYKHK